MASVRIVDADVSALPAELAAPRRLPTQRIPALRPVAIAAYRMRRWLVWRTSSGPFALATSSTELPFVVFEHSSPLLRRLGESQMWLQHNKVTNLRIAAHRIDGVLINPGETFSFCRLVGRTTKRRGYVDGMMLDSGETVPGIGGGICQIANSLHWLVLHSPLTVVQRSSHSEDPFPDDGRTVPWETGCTIFHNYVDLQVRNDTPDAYQFRVWVDEHDLRSQLRCQREPAQRYTVYAKDEHYLRTGAGYFPYQ